MIEWKPKQNTKISISISFRVKHKVVKARKEYAKVLFDFKIISVFLVNLFSIWFASCLPHTCPHIVVSMSLRPPLTYKVDSSLSCVIQISPLNHHLRLLPGLCQVWEHLYSLHTPIIISLLPALSMAFIKYDGHIFFIFIAYFSSACLHTEPSMNFLNSLLISQY